MAYCTNCGAAQNDNAVFCSKCGARIAQTYNQPINQYQPYQQPYAQPMQPIYIKQKGKVFGIFALIIGLIGLLFSSFALMAAIDYINRSALEISGQTANIVPTIFFGSISALSILLSVISMARGYRKAVSIIALVVGIIGVGIYTAAGIMFS